MGGCHGRVGAITDAHIRLWSRTRVLKRPLVVSAPGKGVWGSGTQRVKRKAGNVHLLLSG